MSIVSCKKFTKYGQDINCLDCYVCDWYGGEDEEHIYCVFPSYKIKKYPLLDKYGHEEPHDGNAAVRIDEISVVNEQ